jgi:hypothetical protein
MYKIDAVHRRADYNVCTTVLQYDLSTTFRFSIHSCGIPAHTGTFDIFTVLTEKKASNITIEINIHCKQCVNARFSGKTFTDGCYHSRRCERLPSPIRMVVRVTAIV